MKASSGRSLALGRGRSCSGGSPRSSSSRACSRRGSASRPRPPCAAPPGRRLRLPATGLAAHGLWPPTACSSCRSTAWPRRPTGDRVKAAPAERRGTAAAGGVALATAGLLVAAETELAQALEAPAGAAAGPLLPGRGALRRAAASRRPGPTWSGSSPATHAASAAWPSSPCVAYLRETTRRASPGREGGGARPGRPRDEPGLRNALQPNRPACDRRRAPITRGPAGARLREGPVPARRSPTSGAAIPPRRASTRRSTTS